MSRIFITGSADGLGLMAAEWLRARGHALVLHARNEARAATLRQRTGLPVVVGDVLTLAGMHATAEAANARGPFDAVIHNVAVGYREPRRLSTEDGWAHVFAVNVMAPYVLTACMPKPARLVYLSSGLHHGADLDLDDLNWTRRPWQGGTPAYAESKLLDAMLAFAVARRWPQVRANAMEPGWVPTRMGGPAATDDLAQGHLTQAWLAEGTDPATHASGSYFYHLRPRAADPRTHDTHWQDQLLARCEALAGVALR